jgi:hypothetical protein
LGTIHISPQALQQKWLKSTSLALRCIIRSVFEVWHLGQLGSFDGFRGVEGIIVESASLFHP